MILLIPVNAVLARWLGTIQKEMMKHKDARNKIVNEVLQGIRVIKFFAWYAPLAPLHLHHSISERLNASLRREDSFREKVGGVRNAEMATLRKSAYLRVCVWNAHTLQPINAIGR
jgi:hypothetical protein